MDEETEGPLRFKYVFTLPDGTRKEFLTELDRKTLAFALPKRSSYPEWTALTYQQCSNCPLKESESPRCPAAVSLLDIVEVFGETASFKEVHVRVETEDRNYDSQTTMQRGVSGLAGLRMATSGCPVIRKLRPMTRYHLPFARAHDARFRILSMYLLSQFIRARHGESPDWAMDNLAKDYEDIQTVNRDFARRLRPASGDASVNAIVILSTAADAVSFAISGDMIEELEAIFRTASP